MAANLHLRALLGVALILAALPSPVTAGAGRATGLSGTSTVAATLPSTIGNVSLTWRGGWGETIEYGATGGPGNARGGAIELVVDGDVYASCRQWSSNGPRCSATNRLDPGTKSVHLRFTPNNPEYRPASTVPAEYQAGPARPPASGIAIGGGQFATRTTAVVVDVAATDEGGAGVDLVRLSNSPDTDGSGLLASGITHAYQPQLAWSLSPGPDGRRTVWAQLHHGDSWSAPYSDEVYLDTATPSGTFVINDDDETIGDPWTGSYSTQTISGSVTDTSIDAGGVITQLALSNDGTRFQMIPFDWPANEFQVDWEFSNGWGAPAYTEPGLKTVYAKWRDQAGNWSPVATDTIRFANQDSVGHVLVDGERYVPGYAMYRSSPEVTVTVVVEAPPPDGIRGIWVGNETEDGTGAKWIDWPDSGTEITFRLSLIDPACGYTSGDGLRNVGVKVVSNSGMNKPASGMSVILDRVVPVADAPIPAFALGTHVDESDVSAVSRGVTPTSAVSVQTEIAWRPAGTVRQYSLQRLDGSSWTGVPLIAPKTSSTRTQLGLGQPRRYRVRATLTSGATGAWKRGPSFSMATFQDTHDSLFYSGTWLSQSRVEAYGDSLRYTLQKGSFVRLTFTGRAIAWVAPKGTNGDTAAVYVDGTFVKLVHLTAAYYQPSKVVFSMAWKNAGTHTIKIVKRFDNRRQLPIDALLVLN